jgi:hypothetical protein
MKRVLIFAVLLATVKPRAKALIAARLIEPETTS